MPGTLPGAPLPTHGVIVLGPAQPLPHQVNVCPIGTTGLPALPLKGMQRIHATLEPDGVHCAVCVAGIVIDNLTNASAAETVQRFFARVLVAVTTLEEVSAR